MSFEHKYLKYKQKYLELKQELSKFQVGGGNIVNSETSESLNIEKLTETPTFEKVFGMKQDDLVNYQFEEINEKVNEEKVNEKVNEEKVLSEQNEDSVNIESEKIEESEVQVGGNEDLDTSISELDEIFSQLGGKKKSKDSESDSDSESLSSLSSLPSSSSDFDL